MEFVYFVRILEQTANCASHKIKRLVFITRMESVYCVVNTESLYNIDTFHLQKVKPYCFTNLVYQAALIEWQPHI